MPQVLGLICARRNSKGIPHKNIKPIAGYPLIAHTIRHAMDSGCMTHLMLSTDSEDIATIGKAYGADCFFLRPPEFSEDTSPKLPVIQHALQEAERHYQKQFDIIIDLQPTSPLRAPQDIQKALAQFQSGDYDNVVSATPASSSPYFSLVEQNLAGYFAISKPLSHAVTRRQDAPNCFDLNGSIYIWQREALLNATTLFLPKTGIYVMPKERSIDIDEAIDFEIAEFLLGRQ